MAQTVGGGASEQGAGAETVQAQGAAPVQGWSAPMQCSDCRRAVCDCTYTCMGCGAQSEGRPNHPETFGLCDWEADDALELAREALERGDWAGIEAARELYRSA